MGLLKNDTFICLDCESTGLDPEKDKIIEVAAIRFTFSTILDAFESLIDPEQLIPLETTAIHHITNEMVQGKPKIGEVLPTLLKFIGRDIIVGHGIGFDIEIINRAAKRCDIPTTLGSRPTIDTLRLARLYGESPTNSLEVLRQHFNIQPEGAHRAMNDVIVNIEVFKYLSAQFKTTESILERLKKPILLKAMPLGKHKGRPFSEIPIEYLLWAANKNFDMDLTFSLRNEIKRRKKGNQFEQAGNPFFSL